MVKRIIVPTLVLLVLWGCSYSVFSNAYPHLKKIRVAPFENASTEFDIAEKVYTGLNTEFRNDGRLKPVTQQPDCLLEGSVLSFEEKIFSYDAANSVQDYQLRLTVKVTFTDLVRNEAIYENGSLLVTETYAVSPSSTSRFKTKEEATDELIKTLFSTIIQNCLERW